jgi:hypothetical protein
MPTLAPSTQRLSGSGGVDGHHLWRRWRRTRGDDHVSQTLACCSCRSLGCSGRLGADFRLRLWRPRLAWRLAPRWLGLGRSPLLRRWPGVLWLWRLLCAAPGPDAVGAPLASGQSLLLSNRSIPEVRGPGPVVPGLFAFHKPEPRGVHAIFTRRVCNSSLTGKQFLSQ